MQVQVHVDATCSKPVCRIQSLPCLAFALSCLVLPHFRTAVSRSQQTEATAYIVHYKRLLVRLSLAIELGDGLIKVTVYRDKTRTPRQTPWLPCQPSRQPSILPHIEPPSFIITTIRVYLCFSLSLSFPYLPLSFPPSVDLAWSDQRDCRRDRPLTIPSTIGQAQHRV